MKKLGLYPKHISSVLISCARTIVKTGGITIHAQVHRYGVCNCVFVQTALVALYMKLGDMDAVKRFFDEMPGKNVVSWNSILSGYLKAGNFKRGSECFCQPKEALKLFNKMLQAYSLTRGMRKKVVVAYCAMILGCFVNGKADDAITLFRKCRFRGCRFIMVNATKGLLISCDIPMAQFIINMNAALPASQKFIIHVLDNTNFFVQPDVAGMIRSAIAEFRDQNSYEKPA
ncbi:hypothetical protein PTKIN_Ptkin04bG0199600 [Pterospermum kingtungense]